MMAPSHTPFNELPFYAQVFIYLLWALGIGLIADSTLGKTLFEKVEIKERRFVKANNSMNRYRGDAWSLRVANEHGQGWVQVPKELHDSVREGDTLYVRGKHALISRRWFLEETSKKPPKKAGVRKDS